MMKTDNDYLTGKCLVAMPKMDDERFADTVIYICSHNPDGAMGFIVNKTIKELSFADLANQLPVTPVNLSSTIEIHQGGPLEKIRGFVLHTTDYIKPDTIIIDQQIAVSFSIDILNDIAYGKGPEQNLIALGYASWRPHQLEQEIINNCWLVADPTPELVFKTKDEEKWQKAVDSIGIDLNNLSMICGRA